MKKFLKDTNPLEIIVLIFSFFWLIPLLLIFTNSFKSYNDIIQNFFALPKSIHFDMYIETWVKFKFPMLITNTLEYTISSVAMIVLFAPMAAYKMARTKSRLSKVCFVLIIMPIMVPFQSYMISLVAMVGNMNLTGTKAGMILVTTGLLMPLAIYMIHGFVKNVPIELEECARIDGASPFRIYFSIVLPLLKPIITTVVVLDTLATWNDILTNQLIIAGNSKGFNLMNALYMNFSTQNSDWEHALPGIVISMIPSLLFFIIMQKNIVGGITAGAVKG